MTLHSISSHYVYRISGGWLKQARDDSDLARNQIRNEHRVLTLLGVEHFFDDDDVAAITMPDLGVPLFAWSAPTALAVLDWFERFPDADGAGLFPFETYSQRSLEMADWRRGDHDRHWWDDQIDDVLAASIPHLPGTALVHPDLHLGNWLVRDDGTLQPIDFETAMCGPREANHAFFTASLMLAGYAELARVVYASVADHPNFVRAVCQAKWARSLSWLVWNERRHGHDPEPAARQRVADVADAISFLGHLAETRRSA